MATKYIQLSCLQERRQPFQEASFCSIMLWKSLVMIQNAFFSIFPSTYEWSSSFQCRSPTLQAVADTSSAEWRWGFQVILEAENLVPTWSFFFCPRWRLGSFLFQLPFSFSSWLSDLKHTAKLFTRNRVTIHLVLICKQDLKCIATSVCHLFERSSIFGG